MTAEQRGVVLVGHGSLRAGSGAAMIRLAERAQSAGVAPVVTAGFLNYSRPSFDEALARCIAAGATELVIQPYFLVPGKFVRENLARLVESAQAAHPALTLRLAPAFGDHPALAQLLLQRALEADYLHAHPQLAPDDLPHALAEDASWQPLYRQQRTGMLIMAHGSPLPQSNAPIYAVARRVRARGHYAAATVCFMELNQPPIAAAIDALIARGIQHMIAVPYFLQLGNHVIDDLPAAIEAARARHPASSILLAEHLAYDRLLVSVIADRVAQAVK